MWAGAKGARTTGPVLFDMMSGTRQELLMVAYRFSIAVPELRKAFEQVLARGCRVKLIVDNTEPNQSEGRYFDGLNQMYPNLEIWDFLESDSQGNPAQLHAKVIVSDRKVAVIGSANFSRNGLIENHELGVQIA
jgi:cardiolipin synthase